METARGLETGSAGAVEDGTGLGRAATAPLARLFCVKNTTLIQGRGLWGSFREH